MKHTLFFSFFATITISLANAQNWNYSLEKAKEIAHSDNKLIYVNVYNWGGTIPDQTIYGSRELFRITDFSKWSGQVLEFLNQNFVLLSLDWIEYRNYNFQSSINLMDSNGKLITNMKGIDKKYNILSFLIKYGFDRTLLKEALEAYHNDTEPLNSIRLALAYQEISVRTDDEVKTSLINLSHMYISEAQNNMHKLNSSEKLAKQFLALAEIHGLIVIDKNRKSLKLLQSLEEKDIEQSNLEFFKLLNFLAYEKLGDKVNSKIWKNKLAENDIKRIHLYL